jgi:hypothetical protein
VRAYRVFLVLASILAIELWRARTIVWTRRRRAWLLTLALSVGAVSVYLGCALVYVRNWDYLNGYYHAGRLVLTHAADQFYHRDPPSRPGGFVNLPLVSLLYVPLALLSPTASVFVHAVLGIALVAFTLSLLIRGASARSGTLVAILFLASGALWYSVMMGNVTHFLLLPVYAVFLWSARRRDLSVGILLAGLVIIKPYLLILVAYFTFRRRFRITASFLLTWVAAIALSVAFFGRALNLEWWHFLGRFGGDHPFSEYNNQSLNGFLVRLLEAPNLLSDEPQTPTFSFRLAKLGLLGAMLGGLGWVFLRVRPPRSRQEEWLELAIVLCAGTVIAPIAWTYYYALLLIPLALAVRGDLPLPRPGHWPAVVAAALMMPPTQAAFSSGLRKVLYGRLFISHYFLGGLLLFWVLLIARSRADRRGRAGDRPRNGDSLAGGPSSDGEELTRA